MTHLHVVSVVDPRESLREAVRDALDDFSVRVLHARSYVDVEAHRDELADLILELISPRYPDAA